MSWKKGNPGCPCCEDPDGCQHCTGFTTPVSFDVSVSGMADSSCLSCSNVDGTYNVGRVGTTCQYSKTTGFGGSKCGLKAIDVTITATHFIVVLTFDPSPTPVTNIGYRKTHSGDCDVTGLAVPFHQNQGTPPCDGSSATVTLTSNY